MRKFRFVVALALPLFYSACASPGPVVPVPPTVELIQLESQLITPDAIHFQAKILITNSMRGGLTINKVDYGASLVDNPAFEETFTGLHPMRARGTQTITFPFQIAMTDIIDQLEDVLAEESIRIGFHGEVYPDGFASIPFEASLVIPMPKMPKVALDGVRGNPLDGEFTVYLRVDNPNAFALGFSGIDSFLTLNGKRHDLLGSDCFTEISPGGSGRVALSMKRTRGKALSMLVNIAKNQSADFTVGGSISCGTPHGLFQLPLELSSSTDDAKK